MVCIAAAWTLSPSGGLYTVVWVNLLLSGGLVALSVRVADETRGRALVFLAVLPLARMADAITAAPLSMAGWGSVGTDLAVALGAAVAWFLTRRRRESGAASGQGGEVSRKGSRERSRRVSRWAPQWTTLPLFVASCAAGLALHGRAAFRVPSLVASHSLEADAIVFLVMMTTGLGAEAVFRGPPFDALRRTAGAFPAVALSSALWMALGGYAPGLPAVLVGLANLAYGLVKVRGERTLWIGVAHGLLNGCAMLAVHGLG